MKKLLVWLWLALVTVPALAQVAPVPAPDPGVPVTTMRPNFLYINNVFPKRRLGSAIEMIDVITSDAGGYVPGRWPGYGPGQFTTGGQARNAGAERVFAKRSHFAYDDPIVFPGQKGKNHLHTFFGNTSTSGLSTPVSIRTTGNSTSGGGTVNRSAYWVPTIIYVCDTPGKIAGTGTPNGVGCDPKRNGTVVDTTDEGLNIYYKGYFGVGESSAAYSGSWSVTHDNQPLPVGFRMIAGDANATTPATARDLGFACSVDANHEPLTRFIPGSGISDAASSTAWHYCVDTPSDGSVAGTVAGQSGVSAPGRRLVMRVPFPACRNDAGDLDSPTHNGHIAFEEQDPGQPTGAYRCPPGFSTPMPGVTYHVIYPYLPNDWPFWRLSSDHYSTLSPAGYSIHGDWFNGWKTDIMAEWTFNCDVRAMDCHDHVLGPNPQVLNDAGYATPCVVTSGNPNNCSWRVLRNPSLRTVP